MSIRFFAVKISKIIIVLGVIVIAFGLVFQFQGRGMIGPESSFMYYNKDWISYGLEIVMAGIIIAGAGVAIQIRTRSHAKL